MRHSPAEYFIKYLCSRPGTTVAEVRGVLAELAVGLMPYEDYLQDIYDHIQASTPSNYNPRDHTHLPSVRFLKQEKIAGMWKSTYSVQEAVDVFKNRPLRDLLEHLLLTTMTSEEVSKVLINFKGVKVLGSSVEAFRHYFWNTDLMHADDWAEYLQEPLKQRTKLTALKAPKNVEGMRLVLHKIGVHPRNLDKEVIFTTLRDVGYMNFLESDTYTQGQHKASMLRDYAAIIKESQDKLDEIQAGEEDVIEEFYKKTVLDSRTHKHKSLRELTGETDGESVRQLPSGGDGGS
jgi:hypothetical protein